MGIHRACTGFAALPSLVSCQLRTWVVAGIHIPALRRHNRLQADTRHDGSLKASQVGVAATSRCTGRRTVTSWVVGAAGSRVAARDGCKGSHAAAT